MEAIRSREGRIQAYLSVNRPFKENEAAKKLILIQQTMEDSSVLGNESVDLETLANSLPARPGAHA